MPDIRMKESEQQGQLEPRRVPAYEGHGQIEQTVEDEHQHHRKNEDAADEGKHDEGWPAT